MGCISSLGRVVLVVLNLVFLLVSLAFIAAGVILKFFVSKLVIPQLGNFDFVDDSTRTALGIPELDKVTELPFVDDIGIFFLVFGCILFIISFCACCGACCQWRPLLIVFIILMVVLVIAQAVVGGLFLAKDSVLHDSIKEQLGDKIKTDYDDRAGANDVFTFAINIMNYLLDCCGISGYQDFANNLPVKSCCTKDNMKNSIATCNAPAANADFNTQGCYTKLQDKVLEQQTLAAVILGLILFLQVVEIVLAILIVKDASSVGPV